MLGCARSVDGRPDFLGGRNLVEVPAPDDDPPDIFRRLDRPVGAFERLDGCEEDLPDVDTGLY